MASNLPAACCAKGFRHTGATHGKLIDLNGIETYVVGQPSNKLVLILTDVFGHKFNNNQLLADQFSDNGYFVVMPDLFTGDPVSPTPAEGFDLRADWLPNHMPSTTRPIVDKVVEGIKKEYSPEYIATVGYCYGAKYVVQLLGEGSVQSGAICHPSFVEMDEIKAIKGPLFIAAAETDEIFPAEARHATEATLKELGARYFITVASGVQHGFAVRGDPTDKVAKFAKERAFCDIVAWFNEFAP